MMFCLVRQVLRFELITVQNTKPLYQISLSGVEAHHGSEHGHPFSFEKLNEV